MGNTTKPHKPQIITTIHPTPQTSRTPTIKQIRLNSHIISHMETSDPLPYFYNDAAELMT